MQNVNFNLEYWNKFYRYSLIYIPFRSEMITSSTSFKFIFTSSIYIQFSFKNHFEDDSKNLLIFPVISTIYSNIDSRIILVRIKFTRWMIEKTKKKFCNLISHPKRPLFKKENELTGCILETGNRAHLKIQPFYRIRCTWRLCVSCHCINFYENAFPSLSCETLLCAIFA